LRPLGPVAAENPLKKVITSMEKRLILRAILSICLGGCLSLTAIIAVIADDDESARFLEFCEPLEARYLNHIRSGEQEVLTVYERMGPPLNRIQRFRFRGLETACESYMIHDASGELARPMSREACLAWQETGELPPGFELRLINARGNVNEYFYTLTTAEPGQAVSNLARLIRHEDQDPLEAREGFMPSFAFPFSFNSAGTDTLTGVVKSQRARVTEFRHDPQAGVRHVTIQEVDDSTPIAFTLHQDTGVILRKQLGTSDLIELHYSEHRDGYPMLVRFEQFQDPAGREVQAIDSMRLGRSYFREVVPRNVPRSELLVSHYGWPEPITETNRSGSMIQWWLFPLLGIVLIAVGVWLKRRREST